MEVETTSPMESTPGMARASDGKIIEEHGHLISPSLIKQWIGGNFIYYTFSTHQIIGALKIIELFELRSYICIAWHMLASFCGTRTSS